jgi:hypothetical protein
MLVQPLGSDLKCESNVMMYCRKCLPDLISKQNKELYLLHKLDNCREVVRHHGGENPIRRRRTQKSREKERQVFLT